MDPRRPPPPPPPPPPPTQRVTGDLPRAAAAGGPSDPSLLEPASTGDLVIRGKSETLIVELMSDGRLRAPRERTRQILRDCMSRAEVLPTGPGWAVLRSMSPAAAPSTRERAEAEREAVMTGVLGESAVALIDVIGFLASGLQTGALSVLHGETERAIYLLRGDVVWASSSSPDDRIGEFLVRRGKITRSQLAQVMQASPNRVGRACVERGFIAAHDLWKLVQDQLREIFDRLLATERGVWTFARVSEEALSESQVSMPTQGLLMDAVRKLDEMRLYRESIRSSASVVRRLGDDVQSNAAGRLARLEPHERDMAMVVYAALPARATIQDLMRITGKGEYEITRLVYHLLRAQLVEVQSEEPAVGAPRPNAGITKTQAQDVTVIYSMAIREIFEELGRSGQAAQLHRTAAMFLQNVNGEHAPVLRAARLLPDGAIDEGSFLLVLQGLPITPQQLSDSLSELLFFLLFEASELLGPRRRDDLARRVKMIHGMLSLPDERAAGGPT
ncbi:MAG: DUF4388 domain-containing protein [Deltaproteobacteria bacterium]|nr:DUF4388 domain-containing protein [Deltaproteobacteria bacterium]